MAQPYAVIEPLRGTILSLGNMPCFREIHQVRDSLQFQIQAIRYGKLIALFSLITVHMHKVTAD